MTTAAERQSRRRTKLNKIAQSAEIETWGKLETALLRNEIDITITKKGQIKMNVSNYKPGQKFYMPSTGQIVYLSNDMRLLDTGSTDRDTPNYKTLPTISQEDAWEYEESHGQHN